MVLFLTHNQNGCAAVVGVNTAHVFVYYPPLFLDINNIAILSSKGTLTLNKHQNTLTPLVTHHYTLKIAGRFLSDNGGM